MAAIGSQSTDENVLLTINISASDPDGDIPDLTTSTLPTGASFTDNGDGTGTFNWTPDYTQAGSYSVTFYATDPSLAADSETVAITVNQVNLAPVWSTIDDQTVAENTNLNFNVSASDPDGTIPSLSTSTLPSGATFTDNLDGTGIFDWTPDFTQSGSYSIEFYAADDSGAVDTEIVAITVGQVNQPPTLAAIGSQNTDEGVNLNFGVSASDPDGTTPSLTTSTLPTSASFTDNLDGTGTFDWTPDFTQSGSYSVTFYATDDSAAVDSEIVSITVDQVNQPPVIATLGLQSTTEAVNLTFDINVSDIDGTIATITADGVPADANFTDNGDNTGTFSWTPDYFSSGLYSVTFYAVDDSGAADTEVVSIEVIDAGNQPPVLDPIGPQSTFESVNLNFGVTASDIESTPALTTSILPDGAVFTDNGDGTGTFDWTPNFTQSGVYNVTFYATDDSSAVDSEVVAITVTNSNQPPVLAAIGNKEIDEGVNLNFGVSASDPNGTIPTLTTSTLPTGASFTDNGDGTGTFDWTPDFTQASAYDVTFYATDDSAAADSETVTITVNQVNLPPELAAIGAQSTTENILLSFTVNATDPDGPIPALSTSGLPSGATFIDNGDGTGDFSWTPTYLQSGDYPVTFYATDDSLAVDSEIVTITVIEAGNQLPVLSTIGAKETDENVNLSFGVTANDIESIPILSTSTLPTGAVFTDNGDGTGNFDWTPDYTQAGSYNITFYATDDSSAVDSEVVLITVNQVNLPPELAAIGNKTVDEGVNLNFIITATDPDNTIPSLTSSTLPAGAVFTDNLDGTGTFDWTPDFLQSGTYDVTFYATDDSGVVDQETITITVNQVNLSPELTTIGAQSTTEGVNLNFAVSAVDPDGTIPTLSSSTPLPAEASFIDNGDGTGSFNWTPLYNQSGTYDITFYATDDSGAVDSEIVTITVNEAGNQDPVLFSIGNKSVVEGNNLNFNVSSADPDSTTPSLTTSTLPTGATFADNGDGTGTFDWTPDFTQAGAYDVTFYASDGLATDSELITINVLETGNQRPQFSTVDPQSTTEGILLTFLVSATDPDGTTPVITSSTLPTGAAFTTHGDGTGTFGWTPAYVQSGAYSVSFYATDGVLSDTIEVPITVNEAGNQDPILSAIGAQSTDENVNLSFDISAVDPDSTIPALSAANLPTGASFADNGDGSGSFSWTPDFTQSGSYDVTFFATDDTLGTDSEIVTITVIDAGNQDPILASIGAKSTTENVSLIFDVSATDPDGTIPALTTSALPTGAAFIDNNDGTGSFSWTPDFTQSGSYDVTFYATDDTLGADSEIVTITVIDAGNQTPVLATIGSQSTTEDVNLSFGVSATDPDGTIPALTTSTLPAGAAFIDNGDGTGSFSWTPSFDQAGIYDVTFYATDDTAAVDSEVVAITVLDAGNQSPVLAAIGAQSTTENVNLNFGVSATDPDATIPALSTSILPTGASFTDNGDGTGTFDWTPTFTQSGTYDVTFYASDGALIDSELVTITVNEAGNQEPVLASIGAQSTTENVNLNFGVSATDPDATIPTLTTSTLPTGATFTDNGDGTGTFDWTPTFTQSGSYDVTFYASDGTLIDSELVTITVIDAGNQTPVLATIGSQSTTEEINLTFGVSATDPDGTIPALTTSTLPTGATFIDNGDGTGTFSWTPTFTQAGTYDVTFYAADDTAAVDSEVVAITVLDAGNQSPVLAAIGAQSTTENVNLNFGVLATDPDETIPTLTTSTLPTGASFTDNGDGTGAFDWTPTFTQSGSYDVTFYASDGALIDSELVTITVIDAGNQVPVLAAIGDQSTTENINLNFGVSATDPDETIPALTTSTLPTGAAFTDNGDGTGTFDWTPDFTQSGSYPIEFYASDDTGAVDTELVTITVIDAGNQTPIWATIGDQSTTENVLLTFGVSAVDPDSTIPALTTSTLPTGALFTDNGDGTGSFSWTPDFTQSGSYPIEFYASDDTGAVDTELVTITVNDAGNQSPVLAAIGAQSTTENVNLTFSVSATDPDTTIPSLTTSTLPTGASFTDNGDGTGAFDWTPTFTQSGSYDVTFYASDGALIDSELVTITVIDAGNQVPVLAAIGDQSTTENINLNFGVSATDPDETIPALTTSTLPTGAAFTDNGDGTGTFDWTPDFTQSGSYPIEFYASDDTGAVDTELVTITVIDAGNQTPIWATIGDQSTTENVLLTFGVSAVDPDSTIPALTTSTLPTGALFTDNGDGTGSFSWTPDFTQSGSYPIEFYASDDTGAVDTELVTITVIDAGNQTPIWATIGDQSTTENVLLTFGVSAVDPDSTIPALSTSTLPTGASFIDNGDGTGSFSWTPTYTQSGTYPVEFYASDDTGAVDTEQVTITVIDAGNQAPTLAAIGPQSTDEGVNLFFTVSASDLDAEIPQLFAENLPIGASFTDLGDGTGEFGWTPDYTQSGTYDVLFYASDGVAADSEVVTITVNHVNLPPVADAGIDQIDVFVNSTVTLDGTASSDFDNDPLEYAWTQIGGTTVTLSDTTLAQPTFIPPTPDSYIFQLTVFDGEFFSDPDTVLVTAINASPPQAIGDLAIAINADAIDLSWSPVTLDTDAIPTTVESYIIYRNTTAYFTPQSSDSIGTIDASTTAFTDNNIGGANVVGDTLTQYFYVVVAVDIYGNRSDISNRVGEYDYQIITTSAGDYNLICMPFENSGITTADELIAAIGQSNVNTVNNYQTSSQSFESRFAAGFGVNFAVIPGGIYQVNAAAGTIFSVAGSIPASGAITYNLVTTGTTNFSFISIPFDREGDFAAAQDVLDNLPGSFNTLNRFIAGSQSYESRFAAGFGINFPVKAGKPYQANAANNDVFPGP